MSKYTLKSVIVTFLLIIAGNAIAAMPKLTEEEAFNAAVKASLDGEKIRKERIIEQRLLEQSALNAALEASALEAAIKASKKDAEKEKLLNPQKQALAQAQAQAQAKVASQRKQNADIKNTAQKPSGGAAAAVTPKVQKEIIGDCVICMDNKPLINLSCGHAITCKDCLQPMIDASIKSKNTKQLRCPDLKCKKELEMTDINAITSKQNAAIIAGIKTQEALAADKNAVQCPTPNCPMVYLNDGKILRTIICQGCKKEYCSKCKEKHDRKITCEKHKANKSSVLDKATEEWKKKNTKPCPQCKASIQKTEGCNFMTCKQCKYNFCWLCLKHRQHNEIPSPNNCNCGLWQGVARH